MMYVPSVRNLLLESERKGSIREGDLRQSKIICRSIVAVLSADRRRTINQKSAMILGEITSRITLFAYDNARLHAQSSALIDCPGESSGA